MKTVKSSVIVLAIYLLLAVVLTYPLNLHLDTHVPGHGVDDPPLVWNLWWVKYSIFNLGFSPFRTDYLYYPIGINLIADTSTFLNGVISLPLQLAFGVITAHNLIVYFALIAGGYGTFLLTREMLSRCHVKSEFAAAVAGAFFAFGAWHLAYVEAGQINLLSNEWLPFYALYLMRLDRPSWRNGFRAGLYFLMNAWTELTFALFAGILTAMYAAYALSTCVLKRRAVRWDLSGSQGRHLQFRLHSLTVNSAALCAVAVLGASPLVFGLLSDTLRNGYFLTRGLGHLYYTPPEPLSFLVANSLHPLLGQFATHLSNPQTNFAFVGPTALLLVAIGFLFRRDTPEVRFWTGMAIFCAVILLGPELTVGGQPTGLPLPFAALQKLPFVNANRSPARYNVLLMLALAMLMALGVTRVQATHRPVALGALCLVFAFEQMAFPLPLDDLHAPLIFQTIRAEPGDFTILDLPLGWRSSVVIQGKLDYSAQYFQAIHQKRLLGGLASRSPQFKFQYFLEAPIINSLISLETGRDIDDVRRAQDRAIALQVLSFFNIRYVEVQRTLTDPQVLAYVQDVFPLVEIYRDDLRIVYRVHSRPTSNQVVDESSEVARLYFDDGWGRVQFSSDDLAYRWATTGAARIWLPLTRADYQITLQMIAPRAGQDIQVRLNGQPLQELNVSNQWSERVLTVPAARVQEGLNELVFSTETVPVNATRQDNYRIGETGIASPVDIAATGAGFDAGRFGEVFVAGRNVIENTRGYHLVTISPQTGEVECVGAFDTFAGAAESARLAEFVEQVPSGEIVAGVAIDDVSENLQPEALAALRQLGVETDLRFQFRVGHAFIGVKGAQPGEALEKIDGRWPANVAVGKDVASQRVAFALGTIRVEMADR